MFPHLKMHLCFHLPMSVMVHAWKHKDPLLCSKTLQISSLFLACTTTWGSTG